MPPYYYLEDSANELVKPEDLANDVEEMSAQEHDHLPRGLKKPDPLQELKLTPLLVTLSLFKEQDVHLASRPATSPAINSPPLPLNNESPQAVPPLPVKNGPYEPSWSQIIFSGMDLLLRIPKLPSLCAT